MDLGLQGKVAIVTGGSKGVGRATALRLAQEGAKLAICARGVELLQQVAQEIESQTRGEMLAQKADVTLPVDVQAFVQATVARFGGVDILVNNAGRAQPGRFQDISDELWLADLQVKLFAMLRLCRAVIPHLRKRGGGRIININSLLGKQPSPTLIATSANRAACINFSKALALELAPDNILVNSINLGSIVSDQTRRWWQQTSPRIPFEEYVSQLAQTSNIPLRRLGRAEEVADLVTFLASERSSYITGTSIEVDGGASGYI